LRAVPPLIEALKDSEWKVRRAAAEALGYFTDAAGKIVKPMLERLKDDHEDVRRMAVLSLGRLGKGQPEVEDSIRKLAEDPDPVMKTNVQVALALMGKADDSATPTLIAALGSKEEATAAAAVSALRTLGQQSPEKILPSLAGALDSSEEPLATNALKVVSEMKNAGSQFLPHLVDLYDKVDSKKRRLVLRTVVAMDAKGDQALPLCRRGLADADQYTRREALMGALRYRTRIDTFLEPLIEALTDQNEENLLLAVGIIKGFGNKGAQAAPNLITLAQGATPRVRAAVFTCIGALAPPSEASVRALEAGLGDTNEKTRMAALRALRQVGHQNPASVIPILEKALQNEKDQQSRRALLAALDSLKQTDRGTGSD